MAEQSLQADGLPSTDYYAPDFKVEIEGQELDPASKGDILELKVVMDMENMTSFEFTVNNWNDQSFDFKYSNGDLFYAGNRVQVQMGYADRMLPMVTGQITTITPKFPESGPPTMGVSGLDGMVKLRNRHPTEDEATNYMDMADWEIAQLVAERNGLRSNVTQEGETHSLVVQKNQDDAQFLMERAKRIDFDVFVLTDPDSGEDVLHFVRPTDARDGAPIREYVFTWGQNLINFNPRLTVSHQVGSITVRGWDPRTKQAIVYTAGPDDLPGASEGGNSGPQVAASSMSNKQEVVVDAPITTEQEARELAISLLTERAYEFITGTGQVIGLPDLRPGDNLHLQRLGTRFDGRYYIKKVEHSIGSNGYQTNFEVRRVFDGGEA